MSENKLTFYVLTNKNLGALQRHAELSGIPIRDLHIVINSLDQNYIKSAVEYCKSNQIQYDVTESNGTPSKGKNSVLDIFQQSDNDYAVMIDGDDFLTPHGVNFYKDITLMENAPDVVCLTNQVGLIKTHESPNTLVIYTHLPIKGWVDSISDSENIYESQWYTYTYFYVNQKEIMNRVVLLSKKAAKYRFDEDMTVGEDTVQFLLLKDAHFRGELQAVQLDDRIPTYIYDQTEWGILRTTNENQIKSNNLFDWQNLMLKKMKEYRREGKLHTTPLPIWRPEFLSNYIPDIFDIEPPDLEIIINKYIK